MLMQLMHNILFSDVVSKLRKIKCEYAGKQKFYSLYTFSSVFCGNIAIMYRNETGKSVH